MASKVEALINPELLIWARESYGLSTTEAAKKAQISHDRLVSWERGELRPTVKQLRKLGQIYRRPLAVFYLPEPPKTFQAMHDFRLLANIIHISESPQLRFEIRKAQYRRQVALELYEMAYGAIPEFSANASRKENPENLALRLRELLGISYKDQINHRSAYDSFNYWRNSLENFGLMVFQASNIELKEMRGFSISDTPLPVIVINIKDAPRGRIFTMLHELTHILLREGGLCDLEEDDNHSSENSKIEYYCNLVAGATLIPLGLLLNEQIVISKRFSNDWKDEEISQLARKFGTSWEVVLRRILIAGRTSEDFYRKKREDYRRDSEMRRRSPQEGFAPPHTMAVSCGSHYFVRLVLSSFYQRKITASDLSDFLDVRLKPLLSGRNYLR